MDLSVIERSVRRTRNRGAVISIGIGALAIAMCAGALSSDESTGTRVALIGFGVVFLAVAVGAGYVLAWKNRVVARAPILELLRHDPGDVAWAYVEQVSSTGGRRIGTHCNVHVRTRSGKLLTVFVRYRDTDAVIAVIGQCAPGAALGWSPDNEQRYRHELEAVQHSSR